MNALKGKYRIKGKRKVTDKLVRVYLKSGEEHMVLVHVEIQHNNTKGFARRMFVYRVLIEMRFDVEEVTAIAVFSGDPPPENELQYTKETFGTKLLHSLVYNVLWLTIQESFHIFHGNVH